MRTRTRSTQCAGLFVGYEWDAKGKPFPVTRSSRVWSRTSSTIVDETKNYMGENPCIHSRFYVDKFAASFPRAWNPDRSVFVQYFDTDMHAYGEIPVPTCPSVSFTDALDSLHRDATGAMPLSANLVVNAVEISSLKTLIPQAIGIAKKILAQGLAKKSLKELANGHLLYSFGVKPLITDIKALLNIRKKVRQRIAQLEARNGKTIRLAARGAVLTTTVPTSYAMNTTSTARAVDVTGRWQFTSQCTVSADVSSFFVLDNASQCKLWSSALGLSSPLTSIWELIPFSFVADWLLPIGDTFQRVEDKLGMHETIRSVNITNYTWSTKHVAKLTNCSGTVRTSSVVPDWRGLRLPGPGGSYSSYTRGQGIPASPVLTAPSGWGINRVALSVSLILQKGIK